MSDQTRRRIKIGSQREQGPASAAATEAVAKPEADSMVPTSAVSSDVTREQQPAVGESPPLAADDSAAVETEPLSPPTFPPAEPSAPLATESSVPLSAEPSAPLATDSPSAPAAASAAQGGDGQTVMRPPALERISADLDKEINEALGDMSLNDLLAGDADGTADKALEPESRHQATVVKLHREDVFFSLGGRNEGVISLKLFADPPTPGETMEVIVIRFDASEGLYSLSIPGAAVDVGDWSDVHEGVVVEACVTGHNKGGLECDVNKLRGFIPASQIALYRVDDFDKYVGEQIQCVVTEANPERRNLVLSHRAVLERERAEAQENLLQSIQEGEMREGVVSRIQDFGAFVDLGGIDGLVHVSRLSWDRVNHPSDVLSEGQQIRVRVEKVDRQTGKIGLSYRDTMENPWTNIDAKYQVGSVVSGTVTRLADFGAFVRLESGVEGLIHVSELAHHRVHKVNSILSVDQEVEVKVMSVDGEAQRIGLSLRALQAAPVRPGANKPDEYPESVPSNVPDFKGQLKGGTNKPSGGEKFGLNW